MGRSINELRQFIVFKLDEQLYGVDIKNVQIIEKEKPITRVPKAPRCIKGVINLRGEIIPVICIRELFELSFQETTDSSRIIIVKVDESMIGIIVDEVREVIDLDSENIENVQNIQGRIKASHILGVGKLPSEEGIITLLNLKNIVEEAFEIQ